MLSEALVLDEEGLVLSEALVLDETAEVELYKVRDGDVYDKTRVK